MRLNKRDKISHENATLGQYVEALYNQKIPSFGATVTLRPKGKKPVRYQVCFSKIEI